MTNILYEIKDNEFELEIKGHAGYAEAGNDIVCSAISILVHTLAEHLENVTDDWSTHMESGSAYIRAKGNKALLSFSVILTGFKALARNYPDYVRVTYK